MDQCLRAFVLGPGKDTISHGSSRYGSQLIDYLLVVFLVSANVRSDISEDMNTAESTGNSEAQATEQCESCQRTFISALVA